MIEKNLLTNIMDPDVEFLPLVSEEDESQMNKQEIPEHLPVLPLKNTVLFPGVIIPITISRDKSIKLINDSNNGNKLLGVVAQKFTNTEDPGKDDIFYTGTAAKIIKMIKMPDGNLTVIIQGQKKFQILGYPEFGNNSPYIFR